MDDLMARGQHLLSTGQAAEAVEVFTQAHAAAVVADAPDLAARAMFGWAQAEFGCGRLDAAAEHANVACDQLTALGLPESVRAADLVAQIAHYRYLRP